MKEINRIYYNNLRKMCNCKYGLVPNDYVNENWVYIKDGCKVNKLEKHHLDEDKYPGLSEISSPRVRKLGLQYQRKERLVYCNKYEHYLFHIIINDFNKGKGADVIYNKCKNYRLLKKMDVAVEIIKQPIPDYEKFNLLLETLDD